MGGGPVNRCFFLKTNRFFFLDEPLLLVWTNRFFSFSSVANLFISLANQFCRSVDDTLVFLSETLLFFDEALLVFGRNSSFLFGQTLLCCLDKTLPLFLFGKTVLCVGCAMRCFSILEAAFSFFGYYLFSF